MLFRSMATALTLLTLAALLLPTAARAQVSFWVQVEAHATLRTAEDFAARYEREIGNVGGFRIPGGWYGLAIGPFTTEAEAQDTLRRLLAERRVRSDAYVTSSEIYGQRFWPAGSGDLPTIEAAAPEPMSEVTPEPVTEPVVEAPAEPVVEAAPVAEAIAQAVAEPVVEPVAEPVVEPVVEPVAEPEETLAEARARDASLSRDDRVAIQTALQWFGHYTMRIDGAFGPGTRRSISEWQSAQGLEPTGFLTGRQQSALLDGYADALARYSFATVRDDLAGIELTLPTAMVEFERHESPFVHFREINGSGMRLLLISQEGTQATLFGLYEIMQTLEVIPLEGARERRSNGFLITGQSDTARAHVLATLANGQIKGFALLWEPRADADARFVLETMEPSFQAVAGVLPSSAGAGALSVARRDLLSGLEVRRPDRSRSGFFVDAVGTVVTSAEAVAQCDRITIDEAYLAQVRAIDMATGVAVLTPQEPLVPLAFAQFAAADPMPGSAVRVSGFSFQDTLTRPILTFGSLSDVTGLNGEDWLRRLAITVEPGDSGGPVFDANGAVMGVLMPRMDGGARLLPEDVNFALSSAAVLRMLESAGLRGAISAENRMMPPEILTRVSGDLTVLVSCWN